MSLNVEVLEQSFERVKPNATQFASSFYENLLTDYPQIRPLFANTTMEDQEKKLIMSLVLVVENLRNPGYLTTVLQQLGERHVRYGAMRQHYPIVGAELLKTFESYLGEEWTPEVKQAWTDAYGTIANIMLDGANHVEEISKLESASQSIAPAVTSNAPIHLATASGINYFQESKLETVSPQRAMPNMIDKAPIQTIANTSSLNLKLLAIAFVAAGLLGGGLLHYQANLKQDNNSIKSSITKGNIII